MDKNQQDTIGSKLIATDNKLWIPPLSITEQKRLDRLRKKPFAQRMGFAGKTPWDFIQLLLIPLVLAGVGYWFSFTQTQTSLQISQKQHDNDQQLALDQQQEATLKTYLDDMTTLLLDKKLGSQNPADKATSDEAAIVARAKTLTALRSLYAGPFPTYAQQNPLNALRKATIVQFLYEAHLIGYLPCNTCSRVEHVINLSAADLRDADLSFADLSFADLSFADLFAADLSGADLSFADLSDANLFTADLSGADLSGATVTQEQLAQAKSLQGATMPDGSKHP